MPCAQVPENAFVVERRASRVCTPALRVAMVNQGPTDDSIHRAVVLFLLREFARRNMDQRLPDFPGNKRRGRPDLYGTEIAPTELAAALLTGIREAVNSVRSPTKPLSPNAQIINSAWWLTLVASCDREDCMNP